MTGFVSNTAVEVINDRYINAWTDSQFLLDLLRMIKHLAGVISGSLPSGHCVHYHILKSIFHAERHFLLFKDELAKSERQKTKENIILHGKFRLVENDPNAFS